MKTKLFFSIIFLLLSQLALAKMNFKTFGEIPILNEGRVKPLDTFAEVNLLAIYEKSSLKEMKAIAWLAELLFDPETAFKREVFRIRNKDVTKALNINHRESNLFSFMEVSAGLKDVLPMINELYSKDPKMRSPAQDQLVNLYIKVMQYFEISRSITLLNPVFIIKDTEMAKLLDLPLNKKLNYLDLYKRQKVINSEVEKINKKVQTKMSDSDLALRWIEKEMSMIESTQETSVLKIIPPLYSKTSESHWYSPWETLLQGIGTPQTLKYFNAWSRMAEAYQTKNEKDWNDTTLEALKLGHELSAGVADARRLTLESRYNEWDLFTKAISFYILSFLVLSFSWIYRKTFLEKLSFILLALGAIPHLLGLILRCYIMLRPPVSTLYESTVFVGIVSVVGALIYEIRKKNNIGTFIGACSGAILLFISFGYQKEGDSMGMLAAVLNTNFWLATHVVTITIGYGCSFVASLLGHVYLVQTFLKHKSRGRNFDLKALNQSMNGCTLYALFFTVLGTILGGIWADQSWGRFWGWDPKENGAMLICLWLLFILHGRLAGYFKPKFYAASLVLTSVIVALAWFGVNLLNVGLHSYGFTSSIANNLLTFSLFEIFFAILMLFLIHRQKEV